MGKPCSLPYHFLAPRSDNFSWQSRRKWALSVIISLKVRSLRTPQMTNRDYRHTCTSVPSPPLQRLELSTDQLDAGPWLDLLLNRLNYSTHLDLQDWLLRLSVCRQWLICIVTKRCMLEQKLLLTAYKKSYMRNWLVSKWMTLTLFRGHWRSCHISRLISWKPLGYVHIDTSTSSESGFRFTARTSFTRTSERSWSLVQGQLNACLLTISS